MKKIQYIVILLACTLVMPFALQAQNTATEAPIGINVGNKAPNIIGQNWNGETFKLSDLKGKLVLLDFWASWCGPCRQENPNVVNAYRTYKNSEFKNGNGFVVFSVSLDQNSTNWQQAITTDHLDWPYHVSDLKGWDSKFAGIYKVRSIPSNFLIDENGIIIGKNLRGPMLEKALQQLQK